MKIKGLIKALREFGEDEELLICYSYWDSEAGKIEASLDEIVSIERQGTTIEMEVQ